MQERKMERKKECKANITEGTGHHKLDTHTRLCKQGTGSSQLRNCVQGAVFIGKTILRYDWGGGSVTLCDPAQCSCPCRSRDDDGGVILLFSCFFGCSCRSCCSRKTKMWVRVHVMEQGKEGRPYLCVHNSKFACGARFQQACSTRLCSWKERQGEARAETNKMKVMVSGKDKQPL